MNVYLIRHRQPTLRFTRPHTLEEGAQALIFWNGGTGSGGDGKPGGDNTIDYTGTSLSGFMPVTPRNSEKTRGFGSGRFGQGRFGRSDTFFNYTVPIILHDGDYRFGILFADSLGNMDTQPSSEIDVRIEALPRDVEQIWIDDYNAGTRNLTIAFNPTPEFR